MRFFCCFKAEKKPKVKSYHATTTTDEDYEKIRLSDSSGSMESTSDTLPRDLPSRTHRSMSPPVKY